MYARYGARLLELNVRSFLQIRGKVNQGVRKTILNEPEKFLAYNNGISATAHSIKLMELPGGGVGIGSVTGLQIVNGGQTTATVHYAARKDKADVSRISVQCKLTVVQEDLLQEVVPLISRYANTQNKVNEADFSANDGFHVRLEELSRTIWAPATDGTQRQTKWFYERARGQYQDALSREGTTAKMRQFKQVHPPSQKFTKTDLAKYLNTWEQLPHLVSLGAQKNFAEFTLTLREGTKTPPDQAFFQRLVAKAILFKQAEGIVSARKFGGYRANIVAYTIALLAHKTSARIDLDYVWNHQDLPTPVKEALDELSIKVHSIITSPPGGGNVTEWCKKKACWDAVQSVEWNILPRLKEALGSSQSARTTQSPDDQSTAEEMLLISSARQVDAETWFDVSRWAKETGSLLPWQRSLAYSLGKIASQDRDPSVKQAKQGLRLLEQAERFGFNNSTLTDAE